MTSTRVMLRGCHARGNAATACPGPLARIPSASPPRSGPPAGTMSTATIAPVSVLGRPKTRASLNAPQRNDPFLDGQRVDLDAAHVDDVGLPAAKSTQVADDLHQISGGLPFPGLEWRRVAAPVSDTDTDTDTDPGPHSRACPPRVAPRVDHARPARWTSGSACSRER